MGIQPRRPVHGPGWITYDNLCHMRWWWAGLELLHLPLEELDVPYGLVEHRCSVHLRAPGDQPLEDPDPLADPLPPAAGGDALRIVADPHISSLGLLDRRGVDVHRLHGCDLVHHLLRCSQLFLFILMLSSFHLPLGFHLGSR